MAEPGRAQGIAVVWPPWRPAPGVGVIGAGSGAWSSLTAKLKLWAAAEAGAGRLLPWIPVAFGAGIAVYFAADHEPVLWVTAPVALTLCALAWLLRRHRLFVVGVMVASVRLALLLRPGEPPVSRTSF